MDSINLDKLLPGVGKIIKQGGLVLYDQDNLFRIWDYLIKNPKAPFLFDPFTMELKEERKENKHQVLLFFRIEK